MADVVVDSEPADSVDSYHQEIGRGGRDGEPALGVLVYRQEDLGLRRFFAAGTPAEEELQQENQGPDDHDTPFPVETPVEHREWGNGVVMRVEDDRITVLFDEVGYRTLASAAVLDNDLLRMRLRTAPLDLRASTTDPMLTGERPGTSFDTSARPGGAPA